MSTCLDQDFNRRNLCGLKVCNVFRFVSSCLRRCCDAQLRWQNLSGSSGKCSMREVSGTAGPSSGAAAQIKAQEELLGV